MKLIEKRFENQKLEEEKLKEKLGKLKESANEAATTEGEVKVKEAGKEVKKTEEEVKVAGEKMVEKLCSLPSCSEVGLQLCAGCRSTLYCGQACAGAHWDQHKGDCAKKRKERKKRRRAAKALPQVD